ncbi:hypothetical protein ACFLYP_03915, partial [Chloroflexota bacterium]
MISCPNCGHPNDLHNRSCDNCGISLAIAAAIAETSFVAEAQSQAMPVTPELLVPRLGDYMVEKNLVTAEQLEAALKFQKEQTAEGTPILLGQALVSLNMIDQRSLDLTITDQIYGLQEALRESNQNLELRVEERTQELQYALQKLT